MNDGFVSILWLVFCWLLDTLSKVHVSDGVCIHFHTTLHYQNDLFLFYNALQVDENWDQSGQDSRQMGQVGVFFRSDFRTFWLDGVLRLTWQPLEQRLWWGGEGEIICELYAFRRQLCSRHWTLDNRCCVKWKEADVFPQTTPVTDTRHTRKKFVVDFFPRKLRHGPVRIRTRDLPLPIPTPNQIVQDKNVINQTTLLMAIHQNSHLLQTTPTSSLTHKQKQT